MMEQSVPKGICPMEASHTRKAAGAVCEESFLPEEVESFVPRVAETHDELVTTPIPGPPALLGKGEVEKIRYEVEPGQKRRVGDGVLRMC